MVGKIILNGTQGPIQGRVYEFCDHDIVIFGRSKNCHIKLPETDLSVSRHHFILEVNPPEARLRDLGSAGGTYVNGQKYGGRELHETPEEAAKRRFPEVEIKDGDTIRVGETAFNVRIEIKAQCAECSKDIPDEFAEFCRWQDGLFIC